MCGPCARTVLQLRAPLKARLAALNPHRYQGGLRREGLHQPAAVVVIVGTCGQPEQQTHHGDQGSQQQQIGHGLGGDCGNGSGIVQLWMRDAIDVA